MTFYTTMSVPCCENVEIRRVYNLPREEFEENYFKHGVPVVIEGAVDHWPAKQWTLDSLCERVGQNEVCVRTNTNCQDYRQGTKYNIRQTTFAQYVADLKAGNKRAKNSYMAVQNIKKALPQLQEDVIVPDYVGKMHGGPYMWIARKGHYEYCHTDADDGFLVILNGQKQARLFGCEIEPLYPNLKGTKGRTLQSQVDCDNPDLTKHPLFSMVTCHHCLLNQGDMLYIPAFWWHQITTTETTISVNIFWGNRGTNDYLSKVMAPPLWPIFSHWLLNIIEQNRQCPSFNKLLSRLPEALRHFITNQWHEEVTPGQLETLVTLVLDYLSLDTLPPSCSSGKHPPPLQIRGLLWRS